LVFRQYDITFSKGRPFKPFEQLLGCLPGASASLVPSCFAELMIRSTSPIKHFYPDVGEVKVDMNGKRNPWEGVVLVPFVKVGGCDQQSYCDLVLIRGATAGGRVDGCSGDSLPRLEADGY
jgi:hypothetical protein